MKKILSITLIICLSFTLEMMAQSSDTISNAKQIESLYDGISNLKGVSTVYVGKAMLNNMGKRYYGGLQLDSIKGKINSINIINAESTSSFTKIRQAMSTIIQLGKMELLVKTVDEGDKTEMYLQKDGNYITRFLMINIESDEISIIDITGRFTTNDITNITKNTKNY